MATAADGNAAASARARCQVGGDAVGAQTSPATAATAAVAVSHVGQARRKTGREGVSDGGGKRRSHDCTRHTSVVHKHLVNRVRPAARGAPVPVRGRQQTGGGVDVIVVFFFFFVFFLTMKSQD